jgi:hypothetical protein
MRSEIAPTLARGWRRSLRTEAWYRKRDGWLAVIVADGAGYRIVLRRVVGTFDDGLAVANDVMETHTR